MGTKHQDVVGKIRKVQVTKGDTLIKLGRRFGIGKHEMEAANHSLKGRLLKVGQSVIIPTLFILPPPEYRQGIVINIPELRLYYFPPDGPAGDDLSSFARSTGLAHTRLR